MESLQQILNRLQLGHSKIINVPTQIGKYTNFTPEQLLKCQNDLMIASNAEDACRICQSLADCNLPTKGWIPIYDLEASKQYGYPYFKWRKCHQLKQVEAQQQAESIMGARFRNRSFETFAVTEDNQQAYKICFEYAKSFSRDTRYGLLLTGPVGTGKTHLAAAILKHVFRINLSAAMVSVPQLLEEIKDGFKDGTSRQLSNKVKQKFFLVLDDLGVEKVTDWTQQELYILINARYEAQLPTVVTTNCDSKELIEQVGERTADRLKEMCKPVLLGGKSWRSGNRPIK